MYPIPAVLVNCGDVRPIDIRTVLLELAVPVAAEFPGPEDVLRKWPSPPAERKIFVIRIQGLKQVAAAGKLSDAFPGWPIIALVDGTPDPVGLYSVSRAGAAQILPYPTGADDLSLALDRVAVQFAVLSSPARVIGVTGAAPGSGATTLAINLAAEIAGLFELPTALVELECGLGRLPGLLNLSPPVSVRDLLARPDPALLAAVQSALTPAGDRLFVLAGPHRRVDSFQPAAGRVAHLLGVMRRLVTVTVADLPTTFDAAYFEAAAAANRLVLVGRQDVPTIHAMKLVRDSLLGRGLAEPVLVLNGYDPELETFTPERVGEVLGTRPPRTVGTDPVAVRRAADAGKPLSAVAPRSRTLSDVRWLAGAVLKDLGFPDRVVTDRGERPTLLGRLFGK